MRLDDLQNDRQTQTGAVGASSLAAPEALEDVRPIVGRDPRPAVLDTDRAPLVDFDDHLGSRRRMHERVFDQIAQRIFDRAHRRRSPGRRHRKCCGD
jgi:hypothetical protein